MKSFVFAIPFIVSIASSAQTPVVSDRIVVSASAVPESLESTPASVTIITADEMARQEARDVADVLRQVPGVSIARTGSPGKSTTMFLRGGSSKQALVLWNGVEMNNPYFSGYNFGQLSTVGVERIEIIRGPYSALYGSDAVSGVVNVLTPSTRTGFVADLQAGGNGLRNGSLAGAMVNGRWALQGSAEHREDDGFARNDDFRSDSFSGGIDFLPRANFSLGLLARRNRYELGIPTNVNATSTAFVPTLHRRESGSESQFSIPVRFEANGLRYDVRLSDSRRTETFRDPDAPFGPETGDTDAVTRSGRLSVRSAQTFAGVMTAGAETERASVDHTDSFGLDVRNRSRSSRSFFAEDRFSRSFGNASLQISAGARYDRYESFGSEVSPRIAAAWIVNASKFRAAYGEGFRAPAIGELYAPFFGNDALGAERSRNVEIGFDHYRDASSFSLTAFRGDYDDLITYDAARGRFGNIARARTTGIEAAASHHAGRLGGSVSYTWLRAIDRATGDGLARRPKHSGSATLAYSAQPFGAELVMIYAGQRPDVTDLAPFGAVVNAGYTTADVIVRYDAGAFAPFAKIENATNEQYEENFGYPSARRRLVLGVRYRLR